MRTCFKGRGLRQDPITWDVFLQNSEAGVGWSDLQDGHHTGADGERNQQVRNQRPQGAIVYTRTEERESHAENLQPRLRRLCQRRVLLLSMLRQRRARCRPRGRSAPLRISHRVAGEATRGLADLSELMVLDALTSGVLDRDCLRGRGHCIPSSAQNAPCLNVSTHLRLAMMGHVCISPGSLRGHSMIIFKPNERDFS